MEKYCVKCDKIYDTEQFFCPNCNNILKPDLVQKKKQQIKQEQAEQEKKSYLEAHYTFESYNKRIPPNFEKLLETSLQAEFDFKNRIKSISINDMERMIVEQPETYSIYACESCDNFFIGYCFEHDWNIEQPSLNLCYEFKFQSKLEEPIYDKRVQQLEFQNIVQLKDKKELEKRYSFETLQDLLKPQKKQLLTFFNQSEHLEYLPKLDSFKIEKITTERSEVEFTSLTNLINRTNLKDPIGLVALRMLQELDYNCQNYIVLPPPDWIKREYEIIRKI